MIPFKTIVFAFLSLLLLGCEERMVRTDARVFEHFFIPPEQTNQKDITGKVIRITDGDTFTLIFDNGFDVKVRLNGIDCPERKQAFSKKAKQTLSDLIFNQKVKVYYDSKDGFGRVLGDVYVGALNVNHEMLRRGMAWHFTRYSDDETLAALEKEARKNKIGLWADPELVAPWEFRGR